MLFEPTKFHEQKLKTKYIMNKSVIQNAEIKRLNYVLNSN